MYWTHHAAVGVGVGAGVGAEPASGSATCCPRH